MKTRMLTSTYYMLIIIAAFVSRIFTPYVFDFIIGAAAILGTLEVAKVLEKNKYVNNAYLAGLIPCALYLILSLSITFSFAWTTTLLITIGLVFVVFLLAVVIAAISKKTTSREMVKYQIETKKSVYAMSKGMNTVALLIYPAMLFGSFFILNNLSNITLSVTLPDILLDYYLLATIFVVTILTDTFAMLVGITVKGPKLSPKISPNKTISGAIGGLVGGVLGAFGVYYIFAMNANFVTFFNQISSIWLVVAFGLFGSIFTQIGDIFASLLKRKARVKDYGTIFPGHGGIMDRMDGLVVNAAFVTLTMLIILL